MNSFAGAVLETIKRYGLLQQRDRVLISLSGGPDSVALLLVLIELRATLSLELAAAHVNHQLRGGESDEDEQFVARLCSQTGIPLEVRRVDTRGAVSQSGENLESCARRLRYSFLFELAQKSQSQVATGHTLNDQAETFLMKLMRGSGPGGLAGIHPLRVNSVETAGPEPAETAVVRPLLERTGGEVIDYLEETGQSYRKDSSNLDLDLDRNWVRHRLIPLLEDKLNPALLQTLHRTAGLFREVEDFLILQAREDLKRCKVNEGEETKVSIAELKRLPAILQKEVVRQAILGFQGDLSNITLQHVTEILWLFEASSGKEVHLPRGVKVQREFDELRFSREDPPEDFSYELQIPGEVYVREVHKKVRARKPSTEQKAGAVLIRLQGDSLRVRNRRPGDYYCTSATSSARKLKQLFQKEKIPKSQRAKLIILELDQEIVWVEGFPVHPQYQLSGSQAGAVEIEVSFETLP